MLLIKPSERRHLMEFSFVKKMLDLSPAAAKHINDFLVTPDEEFPFRMQNVFQINNKLELYFITHGKIEVISPIGEGQEVETTVTEEITTQRLTSINIGVNYRNKRRVNSVKIVFVFSVKVHLYLHWGNPTNR